MDGKGANRARVWHHGLSVVIIGAGVILPVRVATAFGGTLGTVVKTVAIVLGPVAASLTVIEGFFNYGGCCGAAQSRRVARLQTERA
ncbi:MAG: hypothetical protein ABSB61_04610 [Anaerolineales bacterium]